MKIKNNNRSMQWNEYLNTLVDIFRSEYAKLGEDGRERVPYNLYFGAPCQIDVIEFLEPQYQILIVSHDENKNDKEFYIHLSPELNKWTYAPYIQKEILSDTKWHRDVTAIDRKKRNLMELLEDFFVNAFDWFGKEAFTKYDKPQIFQNGNAISENIGVWLIKGDLLKLAPLDIALEVCKESPFKYYLPVEKQTMLTPRGRDAEKGFVYVNSIGNYVYIETHEEYEDLENYRVKSFKDIDKNYRKTTETRINGFGAYLFPLVWVDEIPKVEFSQRIVTGIKYLLNQKVLETTYNDDILIVTKEGFIATGTNNKYEAVKKLNTVIASALFNEILMLSIKEFELGEVTIDVQTKNIVGFSASLSSLRNLFGSLVTLPQFLISDRKVLQSEALLNVIKTAEKVSKNEELQNLSLILLESYTHLVNMEHSAAFLLSWYIIEHNLMVRWDNMLNERKITGKRRDKLRSHLLYKTADRVVELLNLIPEISDDEYSRLIKFKDVRNDIVHDGKTPSKEDTEECFNYAYEIIKTRIDEIR